MQFAYLNMGRLSIHPRPQKWRSTMMPNTAFSVNFMRSSLLIVQLWLTLWHSLCGDWLQRACAIPWWSAVQTLSLEGKSLFNYSKGYTCFADAKWERGSNFVFTQPFTKIKCKAILVLCFLLHVSCFLFRFHFICFEKFWVNSNVSFFS